MGLVATMAALVLGLLTGSAKSSFDTQDSEVKQSAADIVQLDRALARYGPETGDIRERLKRAVAYRLALTWPEQGAPQAKLETPEGTSAVEQIDDSIRALSPRDDAQRSLQSRAEQMSGDLLRTRWLILGQTGNAIQMPLLLVLVFWLVALFMSFGLMAPRNATVIAALAVAAMSVSGAIFLILEMNSPFAGVMRISGAPLRFALAHLGQ
jgi:hypothetical protein